MEKADIEEIFEEFKGKLSHNGRARVFEDESVLKSEYLEEASKPEQATLENIIEKVLELANVSDKVGERKFRLIEFDEDKGVKERNRWVDIKGETLDGRKFLLAAKKYNQDLEKDKKDAAVNQISELFENNKDVYAKYDFGIATNGRKWIFIDRSGNKAAELDIFNDFREVRKYVLGKRRIVSEELEEEITEKFYDWYDALLHGGSYLDHEDNRKKIAEEDALVNNIDGITKEEERKRYSQTLMNRLIFVKFLITKNIIQNDVLEYISNQPKDSLNEKLDKFFFQVMNKEERINLDDEFEGVPYLNGSLFSQTEIEEKYPTAQVEAQILRMIINFLDSFNFEGSEDKGQNNALDPEILGFIFERAMNDAERKKSGAYYTPREITEYLAEENIHPLIIERANKTLKERNYKEEELLEDIDDLFSKVNTPTLQNIMINVVAEINICDNACGSGAFLLSAADILFDLWERAIEQGAIKKSKSDVRKLIIRDNLYGIDINPNAVEIAKLRMWLWIADTYDHETAEPLPNIDYNIISGNSLLGYGDVEDLLEESDLSDYELTKNAVKDKLNRRYRLLEEYKGSKGSEARKLSEKIDEIDENLNTLLNNKMKASFDQNLDDFDEDKFMERDPVHWGIEFYSVFDEKQRENRGFDVIVGNPPYVGFKDAKKFERQIFEQKYSDIYNGKNDYLYYFLDRSIDLLRENGRLGYIISRYFLEADFGDKLRKKLNNETRINYIIDFYGVRTIFPELSIDPLVIGFTKKNCMNNRFNAARVSYHSKNLSVREMLNNVFKALDEHTNNEYAEYNRVEQRTLDEECWILADPKEKQIIESIKNKGRSLGGESGICNINQGVITGADKVSGWNIKNIGLNSVNKGDGIFVLSEDELNDIGITPSHEIIRKWCKNSDIEKWGIEEENKEYLIYAHEKFSLDQYSELENHFNKLEGALKGRSGKTYGWQRLHRPRDPKIFDNNKLVTRYKAPQNTFAFDDQKYCFSADIYSITLKPELRDKYNLKFILGILNSTLGDYLVFRQAKRLEYQYEYYPYVLNRISIVEDVDETKQKQIIETVEEITQKGETEELKERLDRKIFEAYNIEHKEELIETVERYKVQSKIQ